jgi:membrane associated rhomboid family serine protease
MPAEEPAGVPTCYRHPDRETYVRCQRCNRPICPDCMNNASVGFQCPSCVAEGRKTTRSGRTPYGGLRPARHGVVSMTLIGINAAIWLLILATGGASSVWVDRLALRPKGLCVARGGGFDVSHAVCSANGGTWLPGVSDGATWQLVTSMFTQVEVLHIGFNMVMLWVLGPQLEMVLGRLRFAGLYLLSGLVGSAVVYWLSGEFTLTLGASGAVFGLMGALLVMAYKVRADMNQLLVWIGINVAFTFFGRNTVSWQGHLGGFVGGVALAIVLAYAPRARRTAWQASGFAAVFALVVVAVVARTAVLA